MPSSSACSAPAATPAARLAQLRRDRSLLDAVAEDMVRLQRTLGPRDRATVDGYLDAVRDVERRLQNTLARAGASPAPAMEAPLGIPDSFAEHARLMFDLQLLAYQADITRVVTFQIGRELSTRSYAELGVLESHHDISHHQSDPLRMAKNTKINLFHMSLFAEFLEKLRSTPDGDGTLLDHAMLLYGGGLGDGDRHLPHDLPLVLVGGGCGQLRGGRHLVCETDTPADEPRSDPAGQGRRGARQRRRQHGPADRRLTSHAHLDPAVARAARPALQRRPGGRRRGCRDPARGGGQGR